MVNAVDLLFEFYKRNGVSYQDLNLFNEKE